MVTRVTRTTTTEVKFGYGATAAALKESLEGVPDEAKVYVTHYEGDQRDPTETTLTFIWDLPLNPRN